jgi:nicotinamide riboside kinase
MSTWPRSAKIAFIGSHGIRKSTACFSFAACVQRGRISAEVAREVVRDNPLGFNEGATAQAQLWVLMTQVRQELEMSRKCDVLVTDRGVMDNFAYFIRAAGEQNPFGLRPFVARWSETYDLVVRLTPDLALNPDGVRSTDETFRLDIETILDQIIPELILPDRLIVMPASQVTRHFDWWPLAEDLAARVGGRLDIV